ncbi:FecR family protein [uncultured Algibacter sp.]|uniref:FecR family protein n=1 Tax=uncultured Algibacter sp. TaxID=298659 RepID=UPI003216FFE8
MKSHITKLLTNTITKQELLELKEWLANSKNQSTLQEYIKGFHDLNLVMLKNNIDEALNKVINEIDKYEKNIKVIPLYNRNLFKYAVAILILITSGYFFLTNNNKANPDTQIIVNNNISTGTNKAILTLEDGSQIRLEKGENYITDNLSSNGEEIIYTSPVSVKPEIAYNYLTVPRGGEYFVKLSDGTQVWLNSESKFKYPVNFIKGETREVELVYGEAYFDVSPSTNHNGSKFKVSTGIQEVEVLGTEFNIKAYTDENAIYTTLVEGKISINNTLLKENLNPGEQSNVNLTNQSMSISKVNVYNEISWKNGVFSFENMPLKKIMKVLSRWYDLDMIFVDSEIGNKLFTGSLGREQSIEEILSIIHKLNRINYKIDNKTIYFK